MNHNLHQIRALLDSAERIVERLRAIVAQAPSDAQESLDERTRAMDRRINGANRELTQLVNKLQTVTIREALEHVRPEPAEQYMRPAADGSVAPVADAARDVMARS